MSFADWDDSDRACAQEGLLLLGWTADIRLTSDEAALAAEYGYWALNLHAVDLLTAEQRDQIADEAYDVIAPHFTDINYRAFVISGTYSTSIHIRPHLRLVDEAVLCFEHRFFSASLALFYIILEKYLRSLHRTISPLPPTFAQLRNAVDILPNEAPRATARALLNIVYSYYNAEHPTGLPFNRHAHIHGLQTAEHHQLNCVRMMILLDTLCFAEGIPHGSSNPDLVSLRLQLYGSHQFLDDIAGLYP